MKLNSPMQNHAAVQGGSVARYRFLIHNTGDQDLLIHHIQPSCGCTIASFDPVIHAGGTGVIKVSVQTQPFWTAFSKVLLVTTNDPRTPQLTLTVAGAVAPIARILPGPAAAVHYQGLEKAKESFTIETLPAAVQGLSLPPAISGPCTVVVTHDKPGAPIYHVLVTVTPPPHGGDLSCRIQFSTIPEGSPPIILQLVALDDTGISVTPDIIDFGSVPAGAHNVHRVIALFSRKTAFHLLDLSSDNPALTAAFQQMPSAATIYDIDATYEGGLTAGEHKGFLTVKTNMPAYSEVKVPYLLTVH